MGALRKAAGTSILVIFLFMTVLRPLFTNPALAGAGFQEIFAWPQVLLYAPILSVVAAIFVLALLAFVRGDGVPTGKSTQARSGGESMGLEENEIDEAELERFENHPDVSSRFLSGQGGARNRGFEIEEKAPDASLGEHLEHLKTELGESDETREDLQALEELVAETEDKQPIPGRCPQEYCDAVWTERTMFGVKTGRYELLDNGEQLQCLECESIYSLDRPD